MTSRDEPFCVGAWAENGKSYELSEHQWRSWRVIVATNSGGAELLGLMLLPLPPLERGREAELDRPTSDVNMMGNVLDAQFSAGADPEAVLTAVELRRLPLRAMLAQRTEQGLDTSALATVNSWPRVMWDADLAERYGLSDADLRALDYLREAFLFADAVANGQARPIVRVQHQLGHASRQTTAGRLTTARKRHQLLTEPPAGRTGGELTDKAKRLVQVMGELAALRPALIPEDDH